MTDNQIPEGPYLAKPTQIPWFWLVLYPDGTIEHGHKTEQMARKRALDLNRAYHTGAKELSVTRAYLERALPILQAYARSNPKNTWLGKPQDPEGVHALLAELTDQPATEKEKP